jgi:hypothetical protein
VADVVFDESWEWWQPWEDHVPDGSEGEMVQEALRRAVDLRDHLAIQGVSATRAVMLVDVLNALADRLRPSPA